MIYVFIAQGFEEIEAISVLDILRRAELEVKAVGIGGKQITGAHGVTVTCDILDSEAKAGDNLEMIVLPGGMPGTINLQKSAVVQSLIRHCAENDIWIGAICAAPTVLGQMGLLTDKRSTCYPGMEVNLGATIYTGQRVEQDGKIVTGIGPGASIPFSLRLVECLQGKEQAKALEGKLK